MTRLHLPLAVCAVVVAVVALTSSVDGLEGLYLIAGAAVALGVLDLLVRRGERPRR